MRRYSGAYTIRARYDLRPRCEVNRCMRHGETQRLVQVPFYRRPSGGPVVCSRVISRQKTYAIVYDSDPCYATHRRGTDIVFGVDLFPLPPRSVLTFAVCERAFSSASADAGVTERSRRDR